MVRCRDVAQGWARRASQSPAWSSMCCVAVNRAVVEASNQLGRRATGTISLWSCLINAYRKIPICRFLNGRLLLRPSSCGGKWTAVIYLEVWQHLHCNLLSPCVCLMISYTWIFSGIMGQANLHHFYKRATSTRRSQRTRRRRRRSWSEGEVRIYYESNGQFETSVYSLESACQALSCKRNLPIFHWYHQAGEDGSDKAGTWQFACRRVFLRTLQGAVGGKKEDENGCGEGGSCCSEASH